MDFIIKCISNFIVKFIINRILNVAMNYTIDFIINFTISFIKNFAINFIIYLILIFIINFIINFRLCCFRPNLVSFLPKWFCSCRNCAWVSFLPNWVFLCRSGFPFYRNSGCSDLREMLASGATKRRLFVPSWKNDKGAVRLLGAVAGPRRCFQQSKIALSVRGEERPSGPKTLPLGRSVGAGAAWAPVV